MRSPGYILGGGGHDAAVVFADVADRTLLGAVDLESLNLRVDLVRKELVPAGPMPVAVAA